jgi:hypothetical protein
VRPRTTQVPPDRCPVQKILRTDIASEDTLHCTCASSRFPGDGTRHMCWHARGPTSSSHTPGIVRPLILGHPSSSSPPPEEEEPPLEEEEPPLVPKTMKTKKKKKQLIPEDVQLAPSPPRTTLRWKTRMMKRVSVER